MWNTIAKKRVEPTSNNGDDLVTVTLDFMKKGQEFIYRVAAHNYNSRISEYTTHNAHDAKEVFVALDCAPSDRTLINAWGFSE